MSAARFKQSDVTRAIRAAKKAGMRVGSVEIDPMGKIMIQSETIAHKRDASEWDSI